MPLFTYQLLFKDLGVRWEDEVPAATIWEVFNRTLEKLFRSTPCKSSYKDACELFAIALRFTNRVGRAFTNR